MERFGESGCAVTADSAATEAVQAKREVLVGEVPTALRQIRHLLRGIVGAKSGIGSRDTQASGAAAVTVHCGHCLGARKHTVRESIGAVQRLRSAQSPIKSRLRDEIGEGLACRSRR